MRAMRRIIGVFALLAGCNAGDACDPFPNRTCIALEVHGERIDRLDEVRLDSAALQVTDQGSPNPPRTFALPVQLAVLPGQGFAGGDFEILVRGNLGGEERGRDDVRGLVALGKHTRITAVLVGVPGPDLAGADLFGFDLAGVDLAKKSVDLAGADLAGVDLSGGPTWHLESVPNFGAADDGLNTVWASGASDVYAVGYHAVIIHSTGDGTWTHQTSNADTANDVFWGVFGTGPGDLYASVNNRVYRSTGNGMWNEETVFTRQSLDFRSVMRLFGFPGNVYAGGSTGDFPGVPVYHTTGNGTWTQQGTATAGMTTSVWGSSATDLYAAGGDKMGPHIFHSTGDGNWSEQTTTATSGFSCIFGTGKNDIYAGNSIGEIWHSTGDGTWTKQATFMQSIEDISGSGPTDLWATGETTGAGAPSGILQSSGNGTWTTVAKPASFGFFEGRGIFALAPDNVYVVGTNEGVIHFHR
jgi:hypothetical protein